MHKNKENPIILYDKDFKVSLPVEIKTLRL